MSLIFPTPLKFLIFTNFIFLTCSTILTFTPNFPNHLPPLSLSSPICFSQVPVVIVHGMGDSCFNPGMVSVEKILSTWLENENVFCIAIGNSYEEDTINSFAMTMNKQVEVFAKEIKSLMDNLEHGRDRRFSFRGGAGGERIREVNAIGFSQGNLIIRAYVQKYGWRFEESDGGYPKIKSFISVHGPMLGVAALPHCEPSSTIEGFFCKLLMKLVGAAAYSKEIQENLAQSNFLRDPLKIKEYLTTDFLPYINFEVDNDESSGIIKGLDSLEEMVLVKALDDGEVIPKESEWFGFFPDGTFDENKIQTFQETKFFQEDSFGLKSMDEKGKIFFNTTDGDHLQLTWSFFKALVQQHWGKYCSHNANQFQYIYNNKDTLFNTLL